MKCWKNSVDLDFSFHSYPRGARPNCEPFLSGELNQRAGWRKQKPVLKSPVLCGRQEHRIRCSYLHLVKVWPSLILPAAKYCTSWSLKSSWKEEEDKMIVTDVVDLTAGAKEFIYVCKKQPFAISCSPYMPKLPETYVDLDLVLKLNIPMKNL